MRRKKRKVDADTAIVASIVFIESLHGFEFLDTRSLKELAHRTKLVLAGCDMLNLNSAKAWEGIIELALCRAHEIGVADEQATRAAVPKILSKIELFATHQDFHSALSALCGLGHCTTRIWPVHRPDGTCYLRVVHSCLECGKHQHSFPESTVDEGFTKATFKAFCARHGSCGGAA